MSAPPKPSAPSRRDLMRLGLALTGVWSMSSCKKTQASTSVPVEADTGPVHANELILFQGDSITDADRDRHRANAPSTAGAMGNGYAWLASDALLQEFPEKRLRIFNRGISGDKVFQLAHRWDRDTLEMAPDVLSILVGVNDFWHTRLNEYEGTAEIYERDFDALLERTRAALPSIRLVVCEPFALLCGSVDESWFPDFDAYRAAAKRLAEKHDAVWVPFHEAFLEACKAHPPEHWAYDGVHPTQAGSELMAQAWLQAVRSAWS